ncbi:nucleoid-associated protein [Pantoea ananatis]|uniref:nucleoid-associated protein n=1 Tax=Pantoea ananas TaxID=553 RepID=UPI0025CAD117|nr:nucleoid-associated protein [Pantoea ananatis]MDN4127902.1 nucleoid-associated protein [Pantoea ananatis]MDN4152017.1 nucleoid-associated protein [Pantoea ananatis]
MMDFNLRHCVIHELVKESGKQKVETVIKPILPSSDLHVCQLVRSLTDLIGKKDNQAARGTFDNENTSFKVPDAFESYYSGGTTQNDFHTFSLICMDELSRQAKEPSRVAASGGAIVFAHYSQGTSNFLLITMVKQKEALSLDENLKPVGTVQIDMAKINQAARVNFDRFENYKMLSGDEKPPYLAFVSPKINQDASGYFVAALGCSDSIPSAKATGSALDGVRSYFEANADIKEYKSAAYDAVLSYLKEKKPGETAFLEEIEHITRQAVPANKHAAIDNLVEYLNGEEIGVPLEFAINRTVVSKRTKIRTKSNGWELSFEKRFFGEQAGSVIQFIKKERKLIISQLDDNAVKKLEDALKDER